MSAPDPFSVEALRVLDSDDLLDLIKAARQVLRERAGGISARNAKIADALAAGHTFDSAAELFNVSRSVCAGISNRAGGLPALRSPKP